MACVVLGCKSHSSRKYNETGFISFHRLPEDNIVKQMWIDAVSRKNWSWTESRRICSKHFEDDCFINKDSKWRRIKPSAVPSISICLDHSSLCGLKSDRSATNELMKPRNSTKRLKCGDCGFVTSAQATMTVHKRMHVSAAKKAGKTKNSSRKRPHSMRSDAEIIQVLQEDVKLKKCGPQYVFTCPKCQLTHDYFVQAYRHIQAKHCVDSDGRPVNRDSPDLIKPIRQELCRDCKQIRTPEHCCSGANRSSIKKELRYTCYACKQHFALLSQFYHHISIKHNQGSESLFFKTYADYTKWQREMQEQTTCKYILNLKSDKKHYYQCVQPHRSDKEMCSSAIIVQDFDGIIQVHYYKDHSGHSPPPYDLGDRYLPNGISQTIRDRDYTEPDSKGLYEDFKLLVTTIMCEAAKLDMEHLRQLYDKALDMTVVVNNFPVDDEPADATDEGRVGRLKGKPDVHFEDDKELCSPKIVDTFSLKEEDDSGEEASEGRIVSQLKIGKVETVPLKKYVYERPTKPKPKTYANVRRKPKYITLPAPNEIAKDTATEQTDNKDNDANENSKNANENNVNMKDDSKNVKVDSKNVKADSKNAKADSKNPKADSKNAKVDSKNARSSKNASWSSFSSFNDTYKDFVENTIGTPIVKKERIRTKLGQFSPKSRIRQPLEKPSNAMRRSLPAKRERKESPSKKLLNGPKVTKYGNKRRSGLGDVLNYEVMEQENDCNILILKC